MKQFFVIRIVAIIALTIAIPDLGQPYGYFELLRFLVCGVSAYLAYRAFEGGHNGLGWTSVFMAVLYNPVFSIHLTRGIWMALNIVAIIYIGNTFRKRYHHAMA